MIPTSFHDGKARAEYIYKDLFRWLFYFANRIVRSSEDAEDIVMTVIDRVAHSPTQPGTYEHLKNRLRVSVQHEAINILRYRNQHQLAIGEFAYLSHLPVHAFPFPCHREREVVWRSVLEEIRRLSPRRQQVLRLYFFEDRSTRQISEQLSVSRQTILNLKAQALDHLRKSGLNELWDSLVES